MYIKGELRAFERGGGKVPEPSLAAPLGTIPSQFEVVPLVSGSDGRKHVSEVHNSQTFNIIINYCK